MTKGNIVQEKIIFAPGVKADELIKNLAIHGVNSFNVRICGASKFADMVLMRSGVAITEKHISSNEECSLVAEAIQGEAYFAGSTYSDIKEITAALRRIRSMVVAEDEEAEVAAKLSAGIFTDKNAALLSVYRKYVKMLKERKLLDGIGLVKKATAEGRRLAKKSAANDASSAEDSHKAVGADFIILKDYPLSPAEQALLEKVTGGSYTELTMSELYGLEKQQLHIEAIKNCYGAPNEAETIIDNIYSKKVIDECTVAVADAATYSQLFFDYALLYDIPVTFGCGIPIVNSNPARLLVDYYHWMTNGFFGKDALLRMIKGKAFSRSNWRKQFPEMEEGFSWNLFNDILCGLRLTNSEEINQERIEGFKKAVKEEEGIISTEAKEYKELQNKKKCIPLLEIAAKELCLPTEEFIKKYSRIRAGGKSNSGVLIQMLDESAVSAIYDELETISKAVGKQSKDNLIENILKMSVCVEGSKAGKLHITDIRGALCTVRKNVYIAGLSATKYPGSPKENYLLLDADIGLFDNAVSEEKTTSVSEYTSAGKIMRKRAQLFSLAQLSADLGSSISLSYAGMNVSELKKDNASSMIFELYKEECGSNVSTKDLEKRIIKVDYFAPAISRTRKVGEKYAENCKVNTEGISLKHDNKVKGSAFLKKKWSPSAINEYLKDPDKFVLQYILGIDEVTDTKLMEVIPATDRGTLAHSLMECIANNKMSKEDFLKLSEEYFKRYLLEHPPVTEELVYAAENEFLDIMSNAYDGNPDREVPLKEKELEYTHPSGIKLHGFPDRVEKLEDGSYFIVDYKSGYSITHKENDVKSCIQIVIYAYLMESAGFKVSGGEYRYIRLGTTVKCQYNDSVKAELSTILLKFKNDLEKFTIMQNDESEAEKKEAEKKEDSKAEAEKKEDSKAKAEKKEDSKAKATKTKATKGEAAKNGDKA